MLLKDIQRSRPYYLFLQSQATGYCVAAIILVIITLPSYVYGASYNCSKNYSNLEKMICGNDELSKIDEILDQRYRLALTLTHDSKNIVSEQNHWIFSVRDKCSDVRCLMAAYQDRLTALEPSALVPRGIDKPIKIDEIGDNWRYKKDEDKVAHIRVAMVRTTLAPYDKNSNNSLLCKDFRRDFLDGRFEVIEPELQALYVNDPRLDVSTHEKKTNNESNDDSKINWHHCDKFDTANDEHETPYGYFYGLSVSGVPPYRFYHIVLNESENDGPQNILLYRELGNGYSHDYSWIDLNACEIKDNVQVFSPKSYTSLNSRDALSLLIRYKGRAVVLAYLNYAKIGENKPMPSISIESLSPHEACSWMDPSLASHQ